MTEVCGEPNPVTGWTCVARTRHVHHRDADGRTWPNALVVLRKVVAR